jgi:hypothetical protein
MAAGFTKCPALFDERTATAGWIGKKMNLAAGEDAGAGVEFLRIRRVAKRVTRLVEAKKIDSTEPSVPSFAKDEGAGGGKFMPSRGGILPRAALTDQGI